MIVDSGTGLQALQRADDIGADDYLGKPFEFRELLARIQAHVRRRHDVFDPVIALGELMVDCGRRRLVWRGRPIDLTPKQFAMVEHLAMAVGRVVTREQMMARLYGWREDAPEAKTLDVHMSHLRKKIREATGGSDIIRTVWGVGYVIERPDAMAAAQPEIGQRPAAALRHEVIARGIAERHGLTLADVRGRDNGHGRLRARYLARAEIALALLTELEWSTAQIGRYFKRNHTTIMAMLRCTAPMVYPHCLEAREAAKRAEAVALRRQGNATKHIAKRMGRSEVWARMVFRAAGLTGRCPAPRSEAAP
jgi:DNA-binding winged helix-turn-helix (wHTH) protein